MGVNGKVGKVLFPESLDRFQITNFLKKSLGVPPKFSNDFTYAISGESIVSTTKGFEQWVRKTFDSEIDLCELEGGEVFPFTVYLEDKFLLFRDKNHNELPSGVVDIRQNTATEVFLAMAQTSSMTERKNLINQEFFNVFFIDPIAGYDLVPADAQIFSDEQLSSFLNNVAGVYQKDTDEDNLHEMFFSENKLNFEEYFGSDYAFSRVRIFICGENIVISHGEKRMFLSFGKQSISLSETLLLGIDELGGKVDIPDWCNERSIGQKTYEYFDNYAFHPEAIRRYGEPTQVEYVEFCKAIQVLFHGQMSLPDDLKGVQKGFINNLRVSKSNLNISGDIEWFSITPQVISLGGELYKYEVINQGIFFYNLEEEVPSVSEDRARRELMRNLFPDDWDYEHGEFIKSLSLTSSIKLQKFFQELERIIRDNFNRDINVDDGIEVSEFGLPLECIFYSEDDNVSLEIDIQINRDYVITVKEVGGLAW